MAVNPISVAMLVWCLHHRMVLIHMQGLEAAQPHPWHYISMCPAAQYPSNNELQGTSICDLVARVYTQPVYS